MCSQHKKKTTDFVCYQDEEFICCLCILQHVDHKDKIKEYTENEIMSDINIVSTKLIELKKKTEDHLNSMKALNSTNKIEASEIKQLFKIVVNFLTTPFCEMLENQEKKNCFPLAFTNPYLFFGDSLALKKCPNLDFLNEIFKAKIVKSVKLLYRGSENNFAAQPFHQKCDNNGPTVLFAKTKNNKYFGAYCTSPWNSSGTYFQAEGTFLFSFDNKTKYELHKAKTHAMYGNGSYGPTFAGNHDLYICNNCFNVFIKH